MAVLPLALFCVLARLKFENWAKVVENCDWSDCGPLREDQLSKAERKFQIFAFTDIKKKCEKSWIKLVKKLMFKHIFGSKLRFQTHYQTQTVILPVVGTYCKKSIAWFCQVFQHTSKSKSIWYPRPTRISKSKSLFYQQFERYCKMPRATF